MMDRAKLRELAEQYRDAREHYRTCAHQQDPKAYYLLKVEELAFRSVAGFAEVIALLDALDAAERERDQLREDAERYRYLSLGRPVSANALWIARGNPHVALERMIDTAADEAIDAARKA